MRMIKTLALAGAAFVSAGAAQAETVYRNDFSGGPSIGEQVLVGGHFTDLGGSSEFPTGPAAYFYGDEGTRSLTLGTLDLATGGTINFAFRLGAYGVGDQNVFEGADGFDEDVFFGYASNGLFTQLERFGVPIFGEPGTGTSNLTGWNTYSYTLAPNAANGSVVFSFVQPDSSSLFFDQWAVDELSVVNNATGAVVAAVPEPATWAMMVLGFGLAGFALRRRGQANADGRACGTATV